MRGQGEFGLPLERRTGRFGLVEPDEKRRDLAIGLLRAPAVTAANLDGHGALDAIGIAVSENRGGIVAPGVLAGPAQGLEVHRHGQFQKVVRIEQGLRPRLGRNQQCSA